MANSSPEANKAGKQRVREPDRSSAAILLAATAEFTEKGFGGARIDAIAARAKINKRMLYHYFGDKEALYLAVLEAAYNAIRSAEAELKLQDMEPAKGMCELVEFTWRYFLQHPEFLSLLATENLHKAAFLKRSKSIVALNSPLIAQITDLLKRGGASGQFRNDAEPVRVYISIAALGQFFLSNRWTLSASFGRDLTDMQEIDAWGAHIQEMILAYLRPA